MIKYIRSNNELEKFAYRVSNDLKSPLNTIIGFSNLFVGKGENLTEKQTQYLQYIVNASAQMKTLIGGILDYSKINGASLKLKQISIHQLIEDVKNLLYHNLNETKGTIKVKAVPEFIIADETKIKQLFLNLISNALKFKKENILPEVIINGSVNEQEYKFSITDNGIGIPNENKDEIFDMFGKAQNNKHFEGHGIGLSICRQIVNQHNGEIWIVSEQKPGTTFHFTLQKMKMPLS